MYIQQSGVCSEPYSKWELRIAPEEVPIPIDSNSGLFSCEPIDTLGLQNCAFQRNPLLIV
jgi:hypothetical protein